ncbi:MAG: anaerobic ribonucleoside-triphosphate reductase activating protein [Clostridia bacterium]|nr:anaerobic ribonucleoside-triphosphate reductase activating protein [Clostridia bacterium]
MLIKGLQKLTLLDFPGIMACTVFTGGCNFRCPFCHNASLVTHIDDEIVTEEEFFDLLDKRTSILQGVCITGGEPTLQADLYEFIGKIREKGYKVKLDTNGYRPNVLKTLVNDGMLDYVAMDIKNSPARYGETVGIKDFDISPILESVEFLKKGNVDFEFRTTVVRELHNAQDIVAIGEWLRGVPKYFLQGYIDSGDCIENGFNAYEKAEMEGLLSLITPYIPTASLRGL